MRQTFGHDRRAKAALLVAVEKKRSVAERRTVPRADARTGRHGAALIANGRIRIRFLLSQQQTAGGDRTKGKRGNFSHASKL